MIFELVSVSRPPLAVIRPVTVTAESVPTDVICVCAASTLSECAMLSPLVAPVEVSQVPAVTVAT